MIIYIYTYIYIYNVYMWSNFVFLSIITVDFL